MFQQVCSMLRDKSVLLCTVSFVLISLSGPLLNAEVYSRMASFFAIGRELSTLFSALAFLLIAYISIKKPFLFDAKQISIVVISVLIVTGLLLALALEIRNPPTVMIALLLRALGQAWAFTVFSVALTTITSSRNVLVAVGAGMVISGLCWQLVPQNLPLVLSCLAMMACSIIPILLTQKISFSHFQSIQHSATAAGIGVSGFAGLKPFRSLLLCMLLVGVASGYALAFNEQGNAPTITFLESIVVSIVVVIVLICDAIGKNEGREDQLFSLAALLIVAGFLVAPYSFGQDTTITNSLLRAGRDCIGLLTWLVLASFGRRNIFLLLPLLGTVRCMSSLGTDLGAMAGHATNTLILATPLIAAAATTTFVFAFISFLWLGFRDFNFSRVINGVKSVTEPEMAQVSDYLRFHCGELGSQFGLTEREIEVFELLAKGRDGRYIANEYVLSYDTVKTHIKHIYQKLNVHSRQELINLVERSKPLPKEGQ